MPKRPENNPHTRENTLQKELFKAMGEVGLTENAIAQAKAYRAQLSGQLLQLQTQKSNLQAKGQHQGLPSETKLLVQLAQSHVSEAGLSKQLSQAHGLASNLRKQLMTVRKSSDQPNQRDHLRVSGQKSSTKSDQLVQLRASLQKSLAADRAGRDQPNANKTLESKQQDGPNQSQEKPAGEKIKVNFQDKAATKAKEANKKEQKEKQDKSAKTLEQQYGKKGIQPLPNRHSLKDSLGSKSTLEKNNNLPPDKVLNKPQLDLPDRLRLRLEQPEDKTELSVVPRVILLPDRPQGHQAVIDRSTLLASNRLNITVPDTTTVPEFKPSVDYAWQNENVRASLFPSRISAFREFLKKQKELDLDAKKKAGFSSDELTATGEKILAERQRLGNELNEQVQLRKEAEANLQTAQTELRELTRFKSKLEAQSKRLVNDAHTQEVRIAVLEQKGDKISPHEQSELDQRRGMLGKINNELATTSQSLHEVNSTLEAGKGSFLNTEARLKGEIEEHKKQEKALKPKFDSLRDRVNTKTKKATPDATEKWMLHEYEQKINDIEKNPDSDKVHNELLGLILDRFDEDKNFIRYPKEQRYEVIHMFGMRYATANKTYGPPKELVTTLKELEIRETFEDPNTDIKKIAEETSTSIKSELKSIESKLKLDKIDVSRKTELHNVERGLAMPETVRQDLYKKNPQFEKLEDIKRQLAEALKGKDDEKATEFSEQIEQLKQEIGKSKLERLYAVLQKADLNRLEVLHKFVVKEAKGQISKLNDLQALSVLQAMRTQFEKAHVWEEIVRRTPLRVNFTESKKWKDPKKPSQMDKLKRSLWDPRWKKIMEGWPRDDTSWKPTFANTHKIVSETVVCNQLSEMHQLLDGKNIGQGIRSAVDWYRKQEGKVPQAFFKRPINKNDFVPNAGLFWAHFEKKKPESENMAKQLKDIPFLTEGYLFSVGPDFKGELNTKQVKGELNTKQVSDNLRKQFQEHGIILGPTPVVESIQNRNKWRIFNADQKYLILSENQTLHVYTEGKQQVMSDGLVEGDWTYHIDQDGYITRTRGKGNKIETQWFAWQHEGTVRQLDQHGNVITFETLNNTRETTRSLQSLVDPMSADWQRIDATNVFVGFAPEGRKLPNLDESLKKILGDRNAF
jgi:hypothetical protein